MDTIVRLQWSVLAAMQAGTKPDWIELSMTMAQVKALFVLNQSNGSTINSIASYLGIGQSSASQLVDKLVKQGLAQRVEDGRDRRRMNVTLSTQGSELVARLYQGGEQLYRSWLTKLDAESATALERGLSALLRAAQTG